MKKSLALLLLVAAPALAQIGAHTIDGAATAAPGAGAIGADTQIPFNDAGTMAGIPGFTYTKAGTALSHSITGVDWYPALSVSKTASGGVHDTIVKVTGANNWTGVPGGPHLLIRNSNATTNNYEGIVFESSGAAIAGIFGRNVNHSAWPNGNGEIVFATANGGGGPEEKGRITKAGALVVGPSNFDPTTKKLWVSGDGGVSAILYGGSLQLTDTVKPTCAFAIRGAVYYSAGAGGVADTLSVCAKNTSDAYVWVQIN